MVLGDQCYRLRSLTQFLEFGAVAYEADHSSYWCLLVLSTMKLIAVLIGAIDYEADHSSYRCLLVL